VKLSGRPSVTGDRPVRTAVGIAINCLETLTADWNRYRLDAEGVNRRTIFVDTTGVPRPTSGSMRRPDNGSRSAGGPRRGTSSPTCRPDY
jgi:hypothetical protein